MNDLLSREELALEILNMAERVIKASLHKADIDIAVGDGNYKGNPLTAGRHACIHIMDRGQISQKNVSIAFSDSTVPYTPERLKIAHSGLLWEDLLDEDFTWTGMGVLYFNLVPKGVGRKTIDDYRDEVRKKLGKAPEPLFLN